MRFTNLVLKTLLTVGCVTALNVTDLTSDGTIPADGFYTGTMTSSGKIEFTYHGPVDVSSSSTTAELDTRYNLAGKRAALAKRGTSCDNLWLAPDQVDSTWNTMKSNCQTWPNEFAVVKYDATVSFFCHYGGTPCNTDTANAAGQLITNACGSYQAGNYAAGDFAYGYTNWALHSFCDCPKLAQDGHCHG